MLQDNAVSFPFTNSSFRSTNLDIQLNLGPVHVAGVMVSKDGNRMNLDMKLCSTIFFVKDVSSIRFRSSDQDWIG